MIRRTTAVCLTGLCLVAPAAQAQRATAGAFRAVARATSEAQAQAPSRTNPTITLMAGIATGDNNLDVGIMVGASFGWDLKGVPLDIRFDPSLARYSGGSTGVDASLLKLGIPAAIQYDFTTTGNTKPYIMGGVGLFYSRYSADINTPGGNVGGSDSNSDLGITVGGGVRFNQRLGLELRIIDVDSFTTIPILLTYRM
jgi:opacity protein-like surface antigen